MLNNCLENKSVFKVTDGRYFSTDNTIDFKINGQGVHLSFEDADINGLKQFEKFNTPEYKTECGSFRFEFYIFDFNVDSENPSKYFLDGNDKKIIRGHRLERAGQAPRFPRHHHEQGYHGGADRTG